MIGLKIRPSIHYKVRYGYYIFLSLMIIVVILNYFNLKALDKKIIFSIVVSNIFDTTLEMRRYEKNFFLYRRVDDYKENLAFTLKAEEIIDKNKDSIDNLKIRADTYSLKSDIVKYKSLMKEYHELDNILFPTDAYLIEGKIRTLGKKLVDTTETISQAEQKHIRELIHSSERFLIGSILFLIFAGFLTGRYLDKVVVKPLKQLEKNMQKISSGKFDALAVSTSDKEIVSLIEAFNRMIKEIETRQMGYIAQSDKLASLGIMVSGIAHQLNNPLSNISTSSQILLEELDNSNMLTIRDTLETVESEVNRAQIMVRSLLDFSRKRDFAMGRILLIDLIDDTIRLLKSEIPSRVEVSIAIPEDIHIIADKQRIQQVFLNIVKNCVDAIPDAGKVSVTAMQRDETGDTENPDVIIRISDTGLGIDPDDIERVFEPFFTTKEKGTGLGLFVSREIIKEHGGKLAVTSNPEQGTTFTITLPQRNLAPWNTSQKS